jgi:peptidylprolyl isomerase
MPSGIKIKDSLVGTGAAAGPKSVIVVQVRGFLNRGELMFDTAEFATPLTIDLAKREVVAGLRQGIVGMRVGGKREIRVSPHLGYGEKGIPGKVPANAVLRFDVELLEIR